MPEFLIVLPTHRTPTAADLAAHRRWLVEEITHARQRVTRYGDAAWRVNALNRAVIRLGTFDREHPTACATTKAEEPQ